MSNRFFQMCVLCGGLTLSSCASLGSMGLQAVGNEILSAVGLGSSESVFDTAKSWSKATEDMNREEEYYLGRAVSAKILADYDMVMPLERLRYINTLGQILATHSDMPETFGGYHFAILRTDEVNAMAAPGGNVFVTDSLLRLLKDEDMLAAVLAHEIAHIVKQHGKFAIQDSRRTQAVLKTLEAAGSVNCAEVIKQATSVFSAAVDDIVQTLVESGYSRDQEREADEQALQILARAGYDPHALFDVFEVLGGHEGEEDEGLFATHPLVSERKDNLKSYLSKHPLPERQEFSEARTKRTLRWVKEKSL